MGTERDSKPHLGCMQQPSGLTSVLSPFLASTPLITNSATGGHLDSWLVALSMPKPGKGWAPLWLL